MLKSNRHVPPQTAARRRRLVVLGTAAITLVFLFVGAFSNGTPTLELPTYESVRDGLTTFSPSQLLDLAHKAMEMAGITPQAGAGNTIHQTMEVKPIIAAALPAEKDSTVINPVNAVPVKAPVETGKSATIVTCPACRLNALPDVRRFVHEHAKLFKPRLFVHFKLGADPVIHMFDNGKVVEKAPLDHLSWNQIVTKLVKFGVPPTEPDAQLKIALQNINPFRVAPVTRCSSPPDSLLLAAQASARPAMSAPALPAPLVPPAAAGALLCATSLAISAKQAARPLQISLPKVGGIKLPDFDLPNFGKKKQAAKPPTASRGNVTVRAANIGAATPDAPTLGELTGNTEQTSIRPADGYKKFPGRRMPGANMDMWKDMAKTVGPKDM